VLFVFHLEILLKLFIQNLLQFILILDRDQTVMEHSKNFVTPKFDQMFFGILVGFLSHVKTLEDFTNITHVEDVVRLGWRRQELSCHMSKQRNS